MAGPEHPLTRLNPFRAVPPVHSPIRPAAVLRASLSPPGDAVGRLRQLLADRFDADDVVLTDSGTHALQLALAHLVEESGVDAVALPAYTCYDVATAGAGAARRLEFYDIDPDTFQPRADSFESALSAGVAAAVVVHHFGIPVDLEPLAAGAAAHGAVLVEDAAQAHGGYLRDQPLGSLASYSVLSFGRGKGWTGGGGGALLLRGEATGEGRGLEARLRGPPRPGRAAAAVKLTAQWLLARPTLYGLPSRLPLLGLGETRYSAPSTPRPMNPVSARPLLATADAATGEARSRQDRARRFRNAMADIPGVRLPPDFCGAGFLRLPVRLMGRATTRVLDPHAQLLGILPSYPQTLASLLQVQAFRGAEREWGGAGTLSRELVTVPTHRLLTTTDEKRIVRWLRNRSEMDVSALP